MEDCRFSEEAGLAFAVVLTQAVKLGLLVSCSGACSSGGGGMVLRGYPFRVTAASERSGADSVEALGGLLFVAVLLGI